MRGKFLIGLVIVLSACLDDTIISQSDQLQKDVAAIDKYLTDNGILAIKDASGLRMVVTQIGTDGLPPNAGNDIKVIYTGCLLSTGAVFDSNTALGKLGDYIPGWQIALPMLPEGSIATLYIPSVYAYGSQGAGSIPPNANLIFDVELESVTPTAAQESKLASDGAAIDTYLASKNITTAVTHSSGLRYEILTPGSGTTPGMYDQVKVNYTGEILPNEVEFGVGTVEPAANFSSRVCNFLQGWQIALPLIQEGGKMRLYIPSGLAYGNQTAGTIPPNSNLFFEIELVDVIE